MVFLFSSRFTACKARGSPQSSFQGIVSMMDWQGQKLAEQLMQILLLVFAVVGFLTGYITGSFQMMVLTYAGGVVLTTLVTVPNWPFFNRNPLKWLDPSEAEKHPKPQPQQPVSSKKKASKK
ncbi:PREDICTED: signal peptidase [Prunus dulcis]|uniref:Signal peptidase complex subunit 1 n=1 Tax=Prunus dulcis TaxID=3755 RepID=A0A5E4EZ07_PRUDU|nr:PREDICTED: signal peptidase [Prunus dulcis]